VEALMVVSSIQRSYLEEAELAFARRNFSEIARILHHVISDSEIRSGEEELDKKWAVLWGSVKENANRYAPPDIIDEINEAIADIEPIDNRLWQVRLSEEQHITILLGAGASNPPPSNIPVVSEFLTELWRRARRLDREDINKLHKWCTDKRITNIEDLLTAAEIANFSTKNSGILNLLEYFLYSHDESAQTYRTPEGRVLPRPAARRQQSDVSAVALLQDTLQILFSLLAEPMLTAQPNSGHEAIADLISNHQKSTIITTNYDGCIDQAITKSNIPCDYLIGQQENAKTNGMAKLIKMHGSINWFYCESCQKMYIYDLSDIKESYEKDKLCYPVMGICKNCGGLSRPMIMPPLSLKFFRFPPLASFWDKAQSAFQEAKIILVVGYSFAEADNYITNMISRAMGADTSKQLIIVDLNRSIASSVRDKLANHIDNFKKERVIRAVESCDVLLPQLCTSLLGEETPAKSEKPKTTLKRRKRIS